MLAEAFICRLAYGDAVCKEKKLNRENNNTETTAGSVEGQPKNGSAGLADRDGLNVFRARDQTLRPGQSQHGDQRSLYYGKESSQALYIPQKDRIGGKQLDLYTSWSSMYASIFKEYPDMHIAGHHILNKKDSGCVLDLDSELQDGPILLSVDIPTNSPPTEIPDKPAKPNNEDKRDRSITIPKAPFSNSALNDYMEKQMQELYEQFIEEHQAVDGSPNPMLFSSSLMNSLNQISTYISQEQNVERRKARQAILNCLRSAASGASSEFVTPVLHISSEPGLKKNPDARSKYSAVLGGIALLK
ncbi:TLR adapter interacting with SLC15A4 on the lysosome-like [Spea bombifrons]|uniref:TLR adapter interacting with SLC15A4 on the lysosome-like n=1 Tax=Spea bombifrons TaxID=233779 RepID=UPI00234A750F|nr:TLR adapter interacting with SLC15A4 on the lysosome-like [Spea bombifrons]